MVETMPSFRIFPGQAYPLGVSELENGVNFAIFSQHATSITLCLSLQERLEKTSFFAMKLMPSNDLCIMS